MLKSLISLFLICAFAMGYVSAARAAEGDAELVTAFKDAARFLPETLMKRGYTTFGNLSFAEFIKKMDSIEVIATGWFARPQVMGTNVMSRSSAQWRRDGNKMQIAVNRKAWPVTPEEVQPVIAFHECLGVMGFNDADYQISTGLWLLAKEEVHTLLKRSELHLIENDLKIAGNFNEGGISGVGGGGDFYGALIKMRGLNLHLEQIKTNTRPERRTNLVENLVGTLYEKNEVVWHLH